MHGRGESMGGVEAWQGTMSGQSQRLHDSQSGALREAQGWPAAGGWGFRCARRGGARLPGQVEPRLTVAHLAGLRRHSLRLGCGEGLEVHAPLLVHGIQQPGEKSISLALRCQVGRQRPLWRKAGGSEHVAPSAARIMTLSRAQPRPAVAAQTTRLPPPMPAIFAATGAHLQLLQLGERRAVGVALDEAGVAPPHRAQPHPAGVVPLRHQRPAGRAWAEGVV